MPDLPTKQFPFFFIATRPCLHFRPFAQSRAFLPMKSITVSQLRQVLLGVSHAAPVGFSALVHVKARKTGNPFSAIAKLSRVNAFTGIDWEASVNRQLGREGKEQDFTASVRAWGERVSPALVLNGEKAYLVAKVERSARPVYLAKRSAGSPWQIVSKSTVAAFLPPSLPANVGTDKGLYYRNYSLDGITRLAIGGETYRVRH